MANRRFGRLMCRRRRFCSTRFTHRSVRRRRRDRRRWRSEFGTVLTSAVPEAVSGTEGVSATDQPQVSVTTAAFVADDVLFQTLPPLGAPPWVRGRVLDSLLG